MFIEIAQAATEAAQVAAEHGPAIADAAAAAVEESSHAPVGPIGTLGLNGKLFVAQLINFGLILFVLWKWAYKPLLTIMDKRQKKIQEGIDNAQKMETRLVQVEDEYEQKVAQAKKEAVAIIEKAQNQAVDRAQQVKESSEAEVQRLIDNAKKQIAAQKDAAQQSIREHAAQLVSAATAKLLEQEVDKNKSEEAVRSILKNEG